MKTDTKLFFGGVPTKPEVDALLEIVKVKAEGQILTKEEIEESMGCDTRSNRGGSIIGSLKRRALRELNVWLCAVPREGYRIADPAERMQSSAGLVAQGRRRIARAAVVAETTDAARLDEEGRKLRDSIRTIPARLRLAELCAPKS